MMATEDSLPPKKRRIQKLIDLAIELDYQYAVSEQPEVGLKLGHWSSTEIAFYDVPEPRLGWLREQLDATGEAYNWQQTYVIDNVFRVIITPFDSQGEPTTPPDQDDPDMEYVKVVSTEEFTERIEQQAEEES